MLLPYETYEIAQYKLLLGLLFCGASMIGLGSLLRALFSAGDAMVAEGTETVVAVVAVDTRNGGVDGGDGSWGSLSSMFSWLKAATSSILAIPYI